MKLNETCVRKREDLTNQRMSKLTPSQVEAITKLQRRFRGFLVKRSFFKALRQNIYIEHKKNFLRLKKCIEMFDRKNRSIMSYFGDSVYDFLNS